MSDKVVGVMLGFRTSSSDARVPSSYYAEYFYPHNSLLLYEHETNEYTLQLLSDGARST